MKTRFLFLWMMCCCLMQLSAQERVVIYQEGFGPGESNANITAYQGWDNKSCVYEGTGRVGYNQKYSCDLPGSSGTGYVYFSTSSIKNLIVKNIDISGYHDLEFSYNLKKEQVSAGKLQVEIWVDGVKERDYNPTLKSTNEWVTLTPRTIPATGKVMDIRMTNGENGKYLYLDDLVVTGVPDAPLAPEKPVISPLPGLYTSPVEVCITAPSGTSVYYTLDGSIPSENSLLYQEPFVLDASATVTAVACSEQGVSDTARAFYDLMIVPSVSDVADFKEASGNVRLDLQQAEVVDVASDGICVQTTSGGLLLPPDAVSAQVGDRVNGFFIGAPDPKFGMTGVKNGVFRALRIVSGSSDPVPYTVSLATVASQPEAYSACLLQLDQVSYDAERGVVITAGMDSGASLRVKTGAWSSEEEWTWSESMTLRGVLKGDSEGMYLWVRSADQVCPVGEETEQEPLGTALVTAEYEGTYCAAKTVLVDNALTYARVDVLDGRAVTTGQEAQNLIWVVDPVEGFLKTPDGRYLHSDNRSVELQLSASVKKPQDRVWKKDPEKGYWMKDQNNNSRALMVYRDKIKLYALSNLGLSAYSQVPAVDMPLYLGYLRTLTPGRWGTLCVPYTVLAKDLKGALFFEIAGRLNDEFGEARALVLSEPVTRLEAGVPYVLYAESSALTLIYSGTEVSEPLNRNGLQGSFTGINVDKDPGNTALQGKYVFSGNVLRKCAAGSSVGANKAYIDLDRVPVLDEQPAGSLRIQVVSGETSVEAPEILCSEEERVYTLGGLYLGLWGQCRDTLPEGCYLVGGHKVVIR